MELRLDRSRAALAAQQSGEAFEAFARQSHSFLLRCASKTARRYITDSDDEYAIALNALYEAVKGYSFDKGPFDAFAALVIRRRIIDHYASEKRHSAEIPVGGALDMDADGGDDESANALLRATRRSITRQSEEAATASAQEEIEALSQVLSRYGFGFFDLADASPRSGKTRAACKKALRWILKQPGLADKCRKKGALPLKTIAQGCGVPLKTLERHRRYLVAALEILTGDYPRLADYFRYIREDDVP